MHDAHGAGVAVGLTILGLHRGDEAGGRAAQHLFDDPPDHAAAFLAAPGHHLLLAYAGDRAVGFLTGIELIHLERAPELLVYDLGVEESYRRRGIASALLAALRALAAERGCSTGTWVATEDDNASALATYADGASSRQDGVVIFSWPPA